MASNHHPIIWTERSICSGLFVLQAPETVLRKKRKVDEYSAIVLDTQTRRWDELPEDIRNYAREAFEWVYPRSRSFIIPDEIAEWLLSETQDARSADRPFQSNDNGWVEHKFRIVNYPDRNTAISDDDFVCMVQAQ